MTDPTPPGPPSSTAARARRALTAVTDHPLLVVLIVAAVVASATAVTIWRSNHLGSYDPDEAGYLATSLRIERHLGPNLGALRQAFGHAQAPLVPILSVPFLIIGPRDPRTAMMIQPVLLVAAAVGVGAITRRVAGNGAAIAAGVLTATAPTMVLAAGAYWFGLATATFAVLALWALFASDRLENRWRFAFGLAAGCMLLSRTMALGFIPALVAVGAIQAMGDRRRLVNLAQSLGVTALVAAPWYIAQREGVFGYLLDYGYRDRAGLWGSGGPPERLWFRFSRFAEGIGFDGNGRFVLLALTVVSVATVALTFRWSRPLERRELDWLTCVAFVALGTAALVSTTNQGVWFETPVALVLLAVIAGGLARLPRPLPVLAAAVTIVFGLSGAITIFVEGERHSTGALLQHDARLADGRQAATTSEEWWTLANEVAAALPDRPADRLGFAPYLSGNTYLFNTNTLQLAMEMKGEDGWVRVPDTFAGADQQVADLTPLTEDGGDTERILLFALHDKDLFTPDLAVDEFHRRALDSGWQVIESWPMPYGGTVEMMRHESNLDRP